MTDLAALAARHVERKVWPLTTFDSRTGPDGYRHYCKSDAQPWPCDAAALLDEIESLRKVRDAATRVVAIWHKPDPMTGFSSSLHDLDCALAATEPTEREAAR